MRKVKKMLPFFAVIALSYYLLSLLIIDFGTTLNIVIPLICFVVSIAYGINNSLNVLYVVFVAILFVPSILMTSHPPLSFFAVEAGIFALIGNAIGMIFYKRNVRIKNLEKYGRYLVIALAGSYIVAVIASAVMMSRMTQITYNATAFGTTIREDIIDFKENTAQRNYYDFYGEFNQHEENSIGTAEKFKIKLVCAVSLFPLWQEYNNPFICDGDTYNIIRTYEGSRSFVYGSNAYPLTYRLVMTTIERAMETTNKHFLRNSSSFH